MAVHTTEQITTKIKSGPDGVHVAAGVLEQAGIHPGDEVVVEVRRYTMEDWIAEGEGRVFTDEEFTAHLKRCPPDQSDS
ncbi:MAG: AbrB/MazE/SpoVT family DNA-binding domain-containing protein [Solirubrobacteraceae bacterium]